MVAAHWALSSCKHTGQRLPAWGLLQKHIKKEAIEATQLWQGYVHAALMIFIKSLWLARQMW